MNTYRIFALVSVPPGRFPLDPQEWCLDDLRRVMRSRSSTDIVSWDAWKQGAPAAAGATPEQLLLREILDTLSTMTTEEFSLGKDREIRRKIAATLGLDPEDYSL